MYGKKPGVVLIILCIIGIVLPLMHYYNKVYPLDIAKGYLDRAMASGDVEGMITYSGKALEVLEPYSGNPKWIFPTPDTDFDLIKQNLRECIDRLNTLSELPRDSDAYQQGLDDVRAKLKVIRDNLKATEDWVLISFVNFIYMILWIIAVIGTLLIWMM